MKRKLLILILFVVFAGGHSFLKMNPPLEIGTLAYGEDYKSVIVGVGNKGVGEVKILDVTVNNQEAPLASKIQVSHVLQGFIITDDFESEEARKYNFMDINEVAIKTGTSPAANYKKYDEGTASTNDISYAVSILHNEEIRNVDMSYCYLGMTFYENVILD